MELMVDYGSNIGSNGLKKGAYHFFLSKFLFIKKKCKYDYLLSFFSFSFFFIIVL